MQYSISLALLASLAAAQTFTDCNPTKESCDPEDAVGREVTVDWTKGKNSFFSEMAGTTLTYDDKLGAVFSISKDTEAPTVQSPEFIFFGNLKVVLQAAPEKGIVTSVVLQSKDLDEIDWEWVGGSPDEVQSNYFSKGDTTTYDRGGTHSVSSALTTFHEYEVDWTAERIQWIIDGKVVRTLTYSDAKGGSTFPQTPMEVKIGTWVAGREGAPEGTVSWSGGIADFSKGKGPYKAYYKSVTVKDYMGGNSTAKQYEYTDKSGTWQSIKVVTDGKSKSSSSSSSKSSSSTATSSGTATGSLTATSTGSSDSDSDSSSSGSDSSSPTSAPASAAPAVRSGVAAILAAVAGAAFFNLL